MGERAGRWTRAGDVFWHETLGAVALLPRTAPHPLALTGSGAALWELLETPSTLEELAVELARRFAADPDEVTRDIAPVLLQLAATGAVVREP